MKLLYIGDITGKLGRETAQELLPDLIKKQHIDFVIAQGENVSHGKGLQANHAAELREAGVNFFSGGNHSLTRPDYLKETSDAIRPANLPEGSPGRGWALTDTPFGKLLVVSLQGQVVGADADKQIPNPLTTIDAILAEHKNTQRLGTVVNFHGDFSSEKVVIGQYLDGKVTAVIGDHWHVQTADAQVQPGGTAHITDVGMTGALDSSLGVKTEIILQRWRDPEQRAKNEMEEDGRRQFCAVTIELDTKTGLAKDIQTIRSILPA
ncbi:MAG TPA: TIGR00282 family metallophosphoesterase [Candidatus Saccharimonadales bacterium]|nr:TIGR00282 family metallophosphoesterase [Candidatus Saccharimonadales bacterium]